MPKHLRLKKEFKLKAIRLWKSSDRPALGGSGWDAIGNRRIRTVESETGASRQLNDTWQDARLG